MPITAIDFIDEQIRHNRELNPNFNPDKVYISKGLFDTLRAELVAVARFMGEDPGRQANYFWFRNIKVIVGSNAARWAVLIWEQADLGRGRQRPPDPESEQEVFDVTYD